ncbi:methyl-accepting chemotaxis protein [Acidovorax sp. HMWF029]|uniref:methyl-accepting chemotaxis protein n=1 Tax=Acidovorax sp. HMWF029 TaxID=2056863 RepID=UPI000D34D9E0|nr:methyl-accepting chemotaxis protein [Acidovorax sp. HMWF029]PTT22043.1 methyl-accepting chemotaxis protein [Acidovorax sp. HMWF029]
MNRLKVSTRLILAFGLLTLIGIVIAAIGALNMRSMAKDLKEVSEDRMVKVAQFSDVNDNLNVIGRLVRNVVISDDPAFRTREKQKIAELRKANSDLLATLDKTITLPRAKELLETIHKNRGNYNKALDRAMEIAEQGDKAAAGALLAGDVQALQDIVFKATDDSRDLQKGIAGKLAAEAAVSAASSTLLMATLGAAMLLLSLVVGWLIVRDLSKALGAEPAELADAAQRVAAGDLSAQLHARRGDEVSVMAAMSAMQQALTGVVTTVRSGADGVATASSEIAQGNSDLSSRTEQQASALEETAASMEELASTVKQNADSARQANQLAVNASTVAVQGGEVVSQVVNTMKVINESSKKIADIISVIDGIAFQTNILALNAAVEAARAGEQGRGFAVVASEVRNLAQRSASAAKDIKALIDNSVAEVERGTSLVDQAGSTMTEVVSAIRRVTDIIGEVSAASNEQSQGVAQVGEAVSQMDQVTQQNAALVEESAAAASSLSTQAQQLLQAVAVFKLSGDAAHSASRPATSFSAPALPAARPVAAPASRPLAPKATGQKIGISAKKPAAAPAPAAADGGEWENF